MEESAGRAALLSGAGGVPPLRGRALRFVLVDELAGHADGLTVAEMVEVLAPSRR